MNKEQLVKLHSDLATLEQILAMNAIAGRDTKPDIEALYMVQAVIERMVASYPQGGVDGGGGSL